MRPTPATATVLTNPAWRRLMAIVDAAKANMPDSRVSWASVEPTGSTFEAICTGAQAAPCRVPRRVPTGGSVESGAWTSSLP